MSLLRGIAEESPRAAARLGRIYMDGRGVPKDFVQAAKWLKKVFSNFCSTAKS